MEPDDLEYFRVRELQERKAAETSPCIVGEVHAEMADRYAKLAQGIDLSSDGEHVTTSHFAAKTRLRFGQPVPRSRR